VSVQYSHPVPIAEIKAASDGSWEVSGLISTFGGVDLGGDTILRGAFDETLASGRKVKFLFAHDQSQVLGTALSLKAEDRGLFGRFKISRTRLGEDVHTLLKDGALDSFSIGYFPEEFEFDPDTGTRLLKKIDLLEASVVAIPMNPDAIVTHVKHGPVARLTMDEEAQAVLGSLKSFVDRCSDLASLRAGDNRVPGAAFFERLQTVRAAADELLALQAKSNAERIADRVVEQTVTAVLDAVDPVQPEAKQDAAPPPGDDAPQGSYSALIALKRARLRRAGLLEPATP
jgi:HK97 family phage prohead protease